MPALTDMAGMFEWKDIYGVQLPSIDREHQNLFETVAELHSAMLTGRSNEIMAALLRRLARYATYHFAHEERIMEDFKIPGLDAHKAEHAAFTRQVVNFQAELERTGSVLTIKVLQFLSGWLVNHIQNSDAKITPFVLAAREESKARL